MLSQRPMKLASAAVLALLLAACEKPASQLEREAQNAAPAKTAADLEADRIFAERCTTCHGSAGAGNGPASATLSPRPRDLRATAWQRSVTDTQIEKVIVGGGSAIGKSPTMPANPDLQKKPEVAAALRAKVRSFATR